MTSGRKRRSLWYLSPVLLLVLVITVLTETSDMTARPIELAIRAAALLGYQLVFLSIVSSAYVVRLVRRFGRPFVHVHHVLSVAALILLSLHPLALAWDKGSFNVFLPRFDSLRVFLELGGRPAWYLIAIASLVALLRSRLKSIWRSVHFLNYLAFWLATVHGNLIGTNFQNPAARVVSILMAIAVVAVFVLKRMPRRRGVRR